jgi:hypothetical protein
MIINFDTQFTLYFKWDHKNKNFTSLAGFKLCIYLYVNRLANLLNSDFTGIYENQLKRFDTICDIDMQTNIVCHSYIIHCAAIHFKM